MAEGKLTTNLSKALQLVVTHVLSVYMQSVSSSAVLLITCIQSKVLTQAGQLSSVMSPDVTIMWMKMKQQEGISEQVGKVLFRKIC